HTWDHLSFKAIMLDNVSLTTTEAHVTVWETPFIDSELHATFQCNGYCDAAEKEVAEYAKNVSIQSTPLDHCIRWVEDPIIIIPWFDSANWWHFLEKGLFPSFLFASIAHRDLYQTSRNVRLATLRWPENRVYNQRTKGI